MIRRVTVPDNLIGAMNINQKVAKPDAGAMISRLLAGGLVYGLAGYGLDYWWGTSFMVGVGIVLGAALGMYAIVASTRITTR